jgi:hypothetical protein
MSRQTADARQPEVGDLYVLAETADFPVEWAILDRRTGNPERLLAVPADTNPLAGSADVEVLANEPAGPLSLRCRFGLWVDAARFDPSRRTGALTPDAVARALARRGELEAGESAASPFAWEADADPEYEDWVREVLVPAHAALARPLAEGEPAAPSPVIPFRRPWTAFGNPYALAASILLMVTLGLAGGLVWQRGQISELAAGRARTEEDLRQEREMRAGELRQAEEAHRREIAERDRQASKRMQEARDRIADLEKRLEGAILSGPLLNAPFVWLSPSGPVRGDPEATPLPPGASHLFVILSTAANLQDFSEYRLELSRRDTAKPVWTAAGLHLTGVLEVSVALPRDLLPPGDYRLRLYGLGKGKAELVGKYEMRIEDPRIR